MNLSACVAPLLVSTVAMAGEPPRVGPFCTDEYAEDLSALQPAARELERGQAPYTFCVRSTATYECPSYGADGNLRTTKRKAMAHGTAFAFREENGQTLLLTNVHVSEWPAVTDDEHAVADVPAGCRRIGDGLTIVDNEADSYARDDIALTRVAADPALDVAVLAAKAKLPVLPWRVGRSASLKERDIVDVRGFPLGVLKATNLGKVVSAYDHDTARDWDHDDFVVDALLSAGNSGSPVLAVSCKTGEFELVGIYHAAYTGGEALNVVIGIDQVRDLMTTLKRTPRAKHDQGLDGVSRAKLLDALGGVDGKALFFPFGPLTARVVADEGNLLTFTVFPVDFPLRARPILVVADAPTVDGATFGQIDRVWAGNERGMKPYARAALDGDTLGKITAILDELRRSAAAALELRDADAHAEASRERSERRAELERALKKRAAGGGDLAQQALDVADRLAPSEPDGSDAEPIAATTTKAP